jgi:hypothetical protein
VNAFIFQFRQRLTDCMRQDWHDKVNTSSRCDFYKHFKSLLDPEKYLCIDIPFPLKKAFARFRCSSHTFKIGTGRHKSIPWEDRLYLHCQLDGIFSIEDEFHVFFQCPKYGDVRAQNLLSWYSAGDSVTDLFNIMQMTDPRKIKNANTGQL